jgi:hypothetical protein
MGGWYNSIHIRSDSVGTVKDVLWELAGDGKCRFYLAPPINGWVGVFAKMLPRDQISTKIAKKLPLDIIELAVYDDDVFCYWYYRQGKLIDSFNSYPKYFGRWVSKRKTERLKGHPEVFSHLVQQSDDIARLREVLSYACEHPWADGKMHEEITRQIKKMESFSKELQDFVRNPDKMIKFFNENPELIDEDIKSLVQIAKQQNITAPEELKKILIESGKPQDTAFKAIKLYVDTLLESGKFAELRFGLAVKNGPHVFDYDRMPEIGCVFASVPMQKFADVLGIKNAVTSYEYLKDGDTDNISRWDEFIEIP